MMSRSAKETSCCSAQMFGIKNDIDFVAASFVSRKEDMIEILQDDQDMQVLTERLVDRANEHGGRDNITAITVKVQGGNQNEQ